MVNGIFGDYPIDEGYKFDVNAYEVTQEQFNKQLIDLRS